MLVSVNNLLNGQITRDYRVSRSVTHPRWIIKIQSTIWMRGRYPGFTISYEGSLVRGVWPRKAVGVGIFIRCKDIPQVTTYYGNVVVKGSTKISFPSRDLSTYVRTV